MKGLPRLKATVSNNTIVITDDNDILIGAVEVTWSEEQKRFYIEAPVHAHELSQEQLQELLNEIQPRPIYRGAEVN